MSKKAELAKNTMIIAVGKMSTQLVSFLLIPIYTIFLTPSEYGTIDLIITYIVLSTPFLTLQLERAAFRYLIDVRSDVQRKKSIVSNILLITLVSTFVCLVVYTIASALIQIPNSILIASSIISTVLSNLFMQIARGFGDNKKYTISSIITGLVTLLANIILVIFLHKGISGVLLSLIIANTICIIYLFTTIKLWRYISPKSINLNNQKMLVKYSLPLIPSAVSWWAINTSDRTIISIFIGFAANGIYAVANKYAAIFTALYSIFDMSWTESASMHINSKDKDSFFSDIYNTSLRIFGSVGLCLIAVLPLIFNLLIDAKFKEAYMYIPILILAALLNSIVSFYSTVYIAKKMTNKVLATSISAALINICLNLVFIKLIGVYAAALSTAIAFLVMAIFRHYDIKKYVNITYKNNIMIKLIIAYAVVIYLYYIDNQITNFINVILVIVISLVMNKSLITAAKNKALKIKGY